MKLLHHARFVDSNCGHAVGAWPQVIVDVDVLLSASRNWTQQANQAREAEFQSRFHLILQRGTSDKKGPNPPGWLKGGVCRNTHSGRVRLSTPPLVSSISLLVSLCRLST